MREMPMSDAEPTRGPAVLFHPKKTGLLQEDVNLLVRAIQAGKTWEQAKQLLPDVVESVLEAWRPEILRRAAIDPNQRRMPELPPAKPAASAAGPAKQKKGGAR